MSKKPKQVSLYLAPEVIRKAEKESQGALRADGLKQSPSGKLREWLLKGMALSNVNKTSR